jgi:hypothetical protein
MLPESDGTGVVSSPLLDTIYSVCSTHPLVLDRVRDVLGAYALVCTPTDQEDPP